MQRVMELLNILYVAMENEGYAADYDAVMAEVAEVLATYKLHGIIRE